MNKLEYIEEIRQLLRKHNIEYVAKIYDSKDTIFTDRDKRKVLQNRLNQIKADIKYLNSALDISLDGMDENDETYLIISDKLNVKIEKLLDESERLYKEYKQLVDAECEAYTLDADIIEINKIHKYILESLDKAECLNLK